MIRGVIGNLLLLVTGCVPAAGALAQTTQPLLRSGEDTLGNPLTYPGGDAAEVSGSIITLMPGESTGWHLHAAPTFGYLLAGELTVAYATGETRLFQAGDGIVEAQHTPHNGRNSGDAAVRMLAFSAGTRGVPTSEPAEPPRPDGFVALRSIVPGIRVELRYSGSDNFMGRPVPGYEADVVYLTREAALALKDVQEELALRGLGLKVFDGYRPQRAVDAFMTWAADPDDTTMKAAYYPTVEKAALIPKGYIAERSGHSRGSTVDVTLVRLGTGAELDMGSPYDYFDPISWPSSTSVTEEQHDRRMELREVMLRHGFGPLEQEWWHFTLRDEPYPESYFDFVVR
jgi:D-alanyl-D-alanine dipeptidase